MAYNNYYPATYQPIYGNQNPYMYQQMQQQQIMQQQAQQAQQQAQGPQIQQSGFVLVQSEQEARAYPVAPGNSITFKDERQPYCYVKTMGFNQLDRPTFERYRLVKEDSPSETTQAAEIENVVTEKRETGYALKSDLDALWDAVEEIRAKVKATADKKPARSKKLTEMEDENNEN